VEFTLEEEWVNTYLAQRPYQDGRCERLALQDRVYGRIRILGTHKVTIAVEQYDALNNGTASTRQNSDFLPAAASPRYGREFSKFSLSNRDGREIGAATA
jgi:hypothetical protein